MFKPHKMFRTIVILFLIFMGIFFLIKATVYDIEKKGTYPWTDDYNKVKNNQPKDRKIGM